MANTHQHVSHIYQHYIQKIKRGISQHLKCTIVVSTWPQNEMPAKKKKNRKVEN